MGTPYQERSAAAQVKIYSYDYYVSRYEATLKQRGMTKVDVEKQLYSDSQLWEMWSDFWFCLPDSKVIRREPFFEICNLCEEEPRED